MPSNIVAIIGRPNVGKSTLFNRILGMREAIVDDFPGVTRDRKYAETEWAGKKFTIIDTGGFVPDSDDIFEKAIREQAQIAIDEADSVIFVVDALEGILPIDREIANILRKSRKTIHLVVNKVDSLKREILSHEFHELGLGQPIPISALAGRQVGDFLDTVTAGFLTNGIETQSPALRLAVVGKPNVGKSSLVNALVGKKRQIVTDVPGTTRDPVDTLIRYRGSEVLLIDTAGLKKRRQTKESLEFYSALRTIRSIERCDVAVILFDAREGVDHQDLHIVEAVVSRKRAGLITVNKWDLVEKSTNTALAYERTIRGKLGMHDHFPIVFISALTKQRIGKVIDVAQEINGEQEKRISTSDLNDILLPEIRRTPPTSKSPKEIRIKYVTQVKSHPPLFALFCNEPALIQESYRRFLINRIREHFGYKGVPISLVFKKK